ncbi:MAG: hemerythrin domain-containing protein [Acidobacteriota bacterium]
MGVSESAWSGSTLSALIQHIVGKHHAFLRVELPAIERMLAEWGTAAAGEHAGAAQSSRALFRRFRVELEGHLKKEEDVLFPMIEEIEKAAQCGEKTPRQAFGSIAHPIGVMEAEHEFARRCLDALGEVLRRSAVPIEIRARLAAMEADLKTHSDLEDRILFPRAIEMESAGQ